MELVGIYLCGSVGEAAAKLQQTLTFYELDLGLNHVVRKYSEPLEEHANLLISVPGGNDGPSGVIICSENYLTYKNLGDQVKLIIGVTNYLAQSFEVQYSHRLE